MPTYLCKANSLNTTIDYVTLGVSATILLFIFIQSMYLFWKTRFLICKTNGIFIYGPISALLLVLYVIGYCIPFETKSAGIVNGSMLDFVEAVLVIEAIIPALLIIQVFEITAILHRNRGVTFCCLVKFEEFESQAADFRLKIARSLVYIFVLTTGIMLLVSNIQILQSDEMTHWLNNQNHTKASLCKSGAFVPFLDDRGENIFVDSDFQIVADILQPVYTCIMCLYFGYALYRYGTYYAFKIYSSWINPWIGLGIFSILLTVSMFINTNGILSIISLIIVGIIIILNSKLCYTEISNHVDLVDFLSRSPDETKKAKQNDEDNDNNNWEMNSVIKNATIGTYEEEHDKSVVININGSKIKNGGGMLFLTRSEPAQLKTTTNGNSIKITENNSKYETTKAEQNTISERDKIFLTNL